MSASHRQRFTGRTVLVTGAAQGIGEAVARQLIAEGAFIYALDVDAGRLASLAAELNRERRWIEALTVDIGHPEAVEQTVERIEHERPIDGLVNGAGVLFPRAFDELTPQLWEDTFRVNVSGTFHVSQSVARRMMRRGQGAIVTIASNAGGTPRMNMSAYCASKAAAVMLTKCMGLELGRHGIRCNVVSPGSTNTAMLRSMLGDADAGSRALVDGDPAAYRTGIPLGRIAEPEDVATAVAFLLSTEARHISLHDLVVDGGATF
jgi:2,3-dihydro-2,3-dihydroxybenzoate dehydrogenase